MALAPYGNALMAAMNAAPTPTDRVGAASDAGRAALDAIIGAQQQLDVPRAEAMLMRQAQPQLPQMGGGYIGGGGAGGANPDFQRRLAALLKAAGGRVSVQGNAWGYRSTAEQARLYAQKPGLAAPPGHSMHERGLAADLSGDLGLAHRLAAQYGLRFPMLTGSKIEPWHIQMG